MKHIHHQHQHSLLVPSKLG
ncbi:hypothetical protein Zm00014a_012100 [Zea mays]|uniref:Uncharacterized protein n=1 Tax=Zea mays TaxID=4577 RepID=A0A3L6G1A4_MAIZE|nr:hypothetical protein Zm00014a_012100 [Zea mays]